MDNRALQQSQNFELGLARFCGLDRSAKEEEQESENSQAF